MLQFATGPERLTAGQQPRDRNAVPGSGTTLACMQGVELCHGTAAESVEEIRRAGLHPPEFPADPATRWTLTSSEAEARGLAQRYLHFGGDGAVIFYRVPGNEADVYLYEPVDLGTVRWYALRKPLPGSMVHHVDYLPAERD